MFLIPFIQWDAHAHCPSKHLPLLRGRDICSLFLPLSVIDSSLDWEKLNIDKNYKEIWHLPTSLSVLLYFWPLHPNCWLPQFPSFQGQGIVDLRTDSDLIDCLIELPTPLHERQGEARGPSIDILTERN